MTTTGTTSAPVVHGPVQQRVEEAAHEGAHWGAVLRLPFAARLLMGTLAGRLPLGMVPLAALVTARCEGHSYGVGAALASLYGLSVAAGQPLLGRLVDQYGQPRVLMGSAVTSATALLALAVKGTAELPLAFVAVLLAGLTAPPLEGALRALWPVLAPTSRHLRAALALDSGTQELVYVAGPLSATALAALGLHEFVFVSAALLVTGGASTVALSPPSRMWRPLPARRSWLGALRSGGLRMLLLVLIAVGAALGALTVASMAAGDRHDAPWLSGALPAAVSVGALLGTAAWTALPLPVPLGQQLLLSITVFATAWLPLCFDPAPFLALVLAVLPGMAFGALLTCGYQAVSTLALPGTLVESYGWLVAAFGLGQALGTAAAGPLTGSWLLPTTAAVLALLFAAPVSKHLALRVVAARPSNSSLERQS